MQKDGIKSFHTKTVTKNKVPVTSGNAVFCKRPVEKEGFFPVEIIYTSFLTNCHWEQYFLHSIAAEVVTDDPRP